MKTNLYINFYVDSHVERHRENVLCLLHNVRNKEIDRLIIVSDTSSLPTLTNIIETNNLLLCEKQKVTSIIYEERPTYNYYFGLTAEYPEDVNIISNSDITFEESGLKRLKEFDWGNNCIALTRWDYLTKDMDSNIVRLHNRRDSQDSWIVKGRFKQIPEAEFCLGKRGCDNKIAYLLSKYYRVINPARSIRSFHLHLTGVRNYCKNTQKDVIPPPYKFLIPSAL